ncbi:alpha/beta fold hydrolase [Mucilaginibacter polytrichastri]|uniref:AB hydrolase-1 domain-containing protein n=1 Tax=Mucilaginibacter polytrichastri TaxID=1302689 RepID=A0A1Q6A201_9SPHI|nr:alpha/beta hydrolase [Mucilaginibacter polytrichastri]OKS88039.1 hypothetical protein RG47T_3503 [Mucilaginibacter polytrichastri]SFT10292.1 Pimeloyl-ACP methyl ester carboxylesterase [Mucilaginibacter polytrichastri]
MKKIFSIILLCGALHIQAQDTVKNDVNHMSTGSNLIKTDTRTRYKTILINGVHVFYREAGSTSAPVILLLHGFPSSSRMFNTLLPLLADRYHLIAPDYPGFGNSEMPPAADFKYTFDHLGEFIGDFTIALGLTKYSLYVQDYGGPIGFRLVLAHPEKITSIIIQNAVSHEQGLSPLWTTRRAFWNDSKSNESSIIKNFSSAEATRGRHVGNNPEPDLINPDYWTDELAWLNKPGVLQIQLDLFYDYKNNLPFYLKFQDWMRKFQPRLLVVWGKYDPSFTVAGAEAYKKDVPNAEIHLLNAGHFALDESAQEIAGYIRAFLK